MPFPRHRIEAPQLRVSPWFCSQVNERGAKTRALVLVPPRSMPIVRFVFVIYCAGAGEEVFHASRAPSTYKPLDAAMTAEGAER